MTALVDTQQFKTGKQVEAWLDTFFGGQGWLITQLSAHAERVQKLGDREFIKGEKRLFIEYKSGLQTAYTGNIFLETVSVDTTNTPGWVYTCKADFVFYACLLNHKILVFRPSTLRGQIEALKGMFKEVRTSKGQNADYNTYGLIVPLDYAERHLAEKVIPISL